MPNLMLTNWCNYKCPYCFGIDFMSPKIKAKNMSRETFTGILNWLEKSEHSFVIHLMGGEPTLNPDFEWFVSQLLQKEFPVTVFSNLATAKAPEYSEKMKDLPINWVVNVNPPDKWNDTQRKNIESSLTSLGKRACITFNIMPDSVDDLWAIELTEKYNLKKEIKVGFVLPTITDSNYHLSDNEYAIVAQKVVNLAIESEKHGMRLEYECGIPTCAFTAEQLGQLWDSGSPLRSGCFSRLDISPDGDCIYCLPLATLVKRHFSSFNSYEEARAWYETKLAPLRKLEPVRNCNQCNLMSPDKCHGACLAKKLIGAHNINIK